MILLVGSYSPTFSFGEKKHFEKNSCPSPSFKLRHLRRFFFSKVSSSDCAASLSCEGSKIRLCRKVVVLQKPSSHSSKNVKTPLRRLMAQCGINPTTVQVSHEPRKDFSGVLISLKSPPPPPSQMGKGLYSAR